jgi:hypothetical protein
MKRYLLLSIAAVFTAAIIWSAPLARAQQRGQELPPLENIQILKGMTPQQVRAEMNKIRDSLGVRCRHCHVVGANDVTNYIPDDKPEKAMARKMMLMVRALNEQEPFKSSNRKVDCFTCHRASAKIPTEIPPFREAAPARPPAQ